MSRHLFRNSALPLACVLIFAGMSARPAHAAGDAARGQALAQGYCSKCHGVGQTNGSSFAPSFPSIAARGRPDQLEAGAFLHAPHPPMPDLHLPQPEIDDIVAYLKSLAGEGGRPPPLNSP
jgi:mono/diheme cytochrome c family protein